MKNYLRLTDNLYTLPNKRNFITQPLQENIKYRKDLYLYLNINRDLTKSQLQDLKKTKSKTHQTFEEDFIEEKFYSKELNRIIIKYQNGDIITKLPNKMPKIPNNQVKTSYKKIGEQHIYIYSFNLVITNQQYTLLSFKKKS